MVRSELVVAFTDNSIRCYNIGKLTRYFRVLLFFILISNINDRFKLDTRQLIAETRSHRNPVNWISMHPKQHVAITSAKSEAIMWNMANWSKQKVLDYTNEDVSLRRVFITK